MTKSEIDLIRRALEVLRRLVPDSEPRAGDPVQRRCPVAAFAKTYLTLDPACDISTAELWRFYKEIAAAGELEPLTQRAFERALPGAMAATFAVKKEPQYSAVLVGADDNQVNAQSLRRLHDRVIRESRKHQDMRFHPFITRHLNERADAFLRL
jgi:hypothetical protein